jgi:hypothetical protein
MSGIESAFHQGAEYFSLKLLAQQRTVECPGKEVRWAQGPGLLRQKEAQFSWCPCHDPQLRESKYCSGSNTDFLYPVR